MPEDRYKVIFDTIACPMFILDVDLKILERNIAASRLEKAAASGENFQKIIQCSSQTIEKLKDPSTVEFTFLPQGPIGKDETWYDVHVKKVTINPGNETTLILVLHDISDLKKAEIAIQHDLQLFFSIIEFLPDPTFVIDIHGKVLAWNRALVELTKLSADEMLGKGDYEYAVPFYGSRRPMLIDYILKEIDQPSLHYPKFQVDGDSISTEIYLDSLRQEGIHLWAKATTLKNAKGELIGAVETIRDITEQKKS